MEDFIELGIEGVDKLVDKHFHKVPNKYIDPHTYRPHLHHRKRGNDEKRSRRDDDEDSINDSEGDEDRESAGPDPRQRRRTASPPYLDHPASYSNGGYEYVAPPATAAAGYGYNYPGSAAGPSPQQPRYVPNSQSAIQDPNDNGFGYLPPPPRSSTFQDERPRRRPDRLIRRSSSQPPGVKEFDRERRREEKDRERRRRANSYTDDRWRDLPGAGRGEGNKTEGGQSNTEKVVLTLLGAAVGGLAVSAVMDRMDKKEKKSDRGEDMRVSGRQRMGGGGRGHRVEGTRRSRKGGGRR